MINLQRPSHQTIDSYFAFVEALNNNGDKVWEGYLPEDGESKLDFLHRVLSRETNPTSGFVHETIYWPCLDDVVIGRISLRHHLNENLSEFGGHVGYEVHPAYRLKGFATEMLKLVLSTPKANEVGRILLTCSPENAASIKTIVANGGILEKTAFVEKWKRETNYYWITL